jgi:hypothetical protein
MYDSLEGPMKVFYLSPFPLITTAQGMAADANQSKYAEKRSESCPTSAATSYTSEPDTEMKSQHGSTMSLDQQESK